MTLTFDEYLRRLEASLDTAVSFAVKTALESKHLYQRVPIEFNAITDRALAANTSGTYLSDGFARKVEDAWVVQDPANKGSGRRSEPTLTLKPLQLPVTLRPPDVHLFCVVCKRPQPFNPVSAEDFLTRGEPLGIGPYFPEGGKTKQVFVLSYLCQGCKRVPEVFMIARDGSRLTVVGRTPIEHVDTPRAIPVSVSKFFGGAIVAHQSGQTLAGLFLLRTLVEQWARQDTGVDGYAVAALDAYMSKLPDDFNRRFPSLRTIYSDLSEDIHGAKGSADLFMSCIGQITEHFDARKIYKL